MRIATIVFSSKTGLGYQSKQFYDHLKPSKTLLVDLSQHNGLPINLNWFTDARYTLWPNDEDIEWLTTDIDVLWVYETPLNYDLFKVAKAKGIKIILYLNPEFLDYFNQPDLPKPDLFICPTSWLYDKIKPLGNTIILRQPIEINDKRKIRKTTHYIHIAGRPAVHDRNGTNLFIEWASRHPEYEYKIYIQPTPQYPLKALYDRTAHLNMQIIQSVEDNRQMYATGDILVLPRRFGGLCLPMLEALSYGMPVIMPNISPNNDLLPSHWLSQAQYNNKFQARTEIGLYDTKPQSIDHIIDNMNIRLENRIAHEIARKHSWENLQPLYQNTIENVCLL